MYPGSESWEETVVLCDGLAGLSAGRACARDGEGVEGRGERAGGGGGGGTRGAPPRPRGGDTPHTRPPH